MWSLRRGGAVVDHLRGSRYVNIVGRARDDYRGSHHYITAFRDDHHV